jgi:hypothetical protein
MILRRDELARAAGTGLEARSERFAGVEREIRQAQAEALGRTGERLQGLLDAVAAMDRQLDAREGSAAGPGCDTAALRATTAARNRLRDEAARLRHHLIIQREALGLARHGTVEHCYPLPARREPVGGPTSEEGPP